MHATGDEPPAIPPVDAVLRRMGATPLIPVGVTPASWEVRESAPPPMVPGALCSTGGGARRIIWGNAPPTADIRDLAVDLIVWDHEQARPFYDPDLDGELTAATALEVMNTAIDFRERVRRTTTSARMVRIEVGGRAFDAELLSCAEVGQELVALVHPDVCFVAGGPGLTRLDFRWEQEPPPRP